MGRLRPARPASRPTARGRRHNGCHDLGAPWAAMTSASPELRAARQMVRSLQNDERVSAEHAALVRLVLSTAEDYGAARRDPSTPAYALPKLAQAHRSAVLALSDAAAPVLAEDEFTRLMAEALRPTPGTPAWGDGDT
jgi:hypothetical protein